METIFEGTDAPVIVRSRKPKTNPAAPKTKRQPNYAVIVLDDDLHSYGYVIEVLGRVCGHDFQKAMTLATEIDFLGRAIVWTGTLELAELKRDQIVGFGPEVTASKTVTMPLGCVIEPLPG